MYRGLGWAGLDWGLAGIRREFGAGQQDKWALSVQCRLGRERSTYLIHNPMSISNGEREGRQGGGRRRGRLMSNSAAGWDGTRQQKRPHMQRVVVRVHRSVVGHLKPEHLALGPPFRR